MTTLERLNELKNIYNEKQEITKDIYLQAESELIQIVGEHTIDSEMLCTAYGSGTITAFEGASLDYMAVSITFTDVTKKFLLIHILNNGFIKFANASEIIDVWNSALEIHTELTKAKRNYEATVKQQKAEAEKKAIAEKKAEEKYQKQKANAIQAFEDMQNRVKDLSPQTSDFYFALGWLAKHIGTLTATLPDYLGTAFEKHFGPDAPKTLVDSRAKTSGGYAKQWSWEFKCTIKKLKETVVPACIQNVTADFSKGIHNTSFLWDLVESYGFQFGKTQDIDKIKANIPTEAMDSFEAGLIS